MRGISGSLSQCCSNVYHQFNEMSKPSKVALTAILAGGIGGLVAKGLQARVISSNFLGSFSALKVAGAVAGLAALGGCYFLGSKSSSQQKGELPIPRGVGEGKSPEKSRAASEEKSSPNGKEILSQVPFAQKLPVWLRKAIENSGFHFAVFQGRDPSMDSMDRRFSRPIDESSQETIKSQPITFYYGDKYGAMGIELTAEMKRAGDPSPKMIKIRIGKAFPRDDRSYMWQAIPSGGSNISCFAYSDEGNPDHPRPHWLPFGEGFKGETFKLSEGIGPFDVDQMLVRFLSGQSYTFELNKPITRTEKGVKWETAQITLSLKCE